MALLLGWIVGTALAGDVLTFDALRNAGPGETPVTFHVGATGRLLAEGDCRTGRTWTVDQRTRAGQDVVLAFDGIAGGPHPCLVDVTFEADGMEPVGTQLTFDVSQSGPLQLAYTADEVDTKGGVVTVSADRAVAEATMTVIGPRGVTLAEARVDLSDPGRPRFAWDPAGETVKLDIHAKAADGGTAHLELFPWSYTIPHVDVVFETGSDVVRDSEVSKLDAAMDEVRRTLEVYGSIVKMQLYVVGYTDTVGDAASNRALSERRARSIARWFREAGFDRPVFYQGFGEDVLAVATPDGTPEEANRRADYVLSAQAPPVSSAYPRGNWKRL